MAVYKDEEKGTWYAKFRYTDWTGKGRSTTKRGFKTKREAKAYEVDFKRKSQEMPDMTVKELCRRYLEAIKPRWKESTYIVRANYLKTYVLTVIGDMPLSSITKSTIVEWQNWLIAQGKGESTMTTINVALTALLNYAVKMEWIPRSPAANIQRVGKVANRLDFWTLAEYERFLEAGEGDKEFQRIHLAFDILFFSGIRIGEFLGLGKNSFAKNQIIILHTIDTHTGQKSTPKN